MVLTVCFYHPESPAVTFKQGVPERDRVGERADEYRETERERDVSC